MAIALGMTVVTVVGLVQSVRSNSLPVERLGYLVSDSREASDPAAEDSVRVLYEVNLLKVPEHQTNGTAHISIGRRFLAFLYDTTNSRYVYDTHDPRFAPDTPPVLPEYSALTIAITIERDTTELALIRIPLNCVRSCEDINGYERRQKLLDKELSMTVRGDSGQYPSDEYFGNATVTVELPSSLTLRDPDHPDDLIHMVSTAVTVGHSLGGKNLYYVPQAGDTELLYLRDMGLGITRNFWSQAFVYGALGAPILLAFVIGDLLRRIQRLGTEAAAVTLVGLGTVLLAVLPLKVVLVPSEIGDVTRVDRILLVELMVVLSVMVFIYVRSLWKS